MSKQPISLWTTRAHELLTAQARILADALRDQDPDDPDLEKRYATTLAGDERKLRGIPVLARGCGSAIPGTQPLQALMAKQRKID